MITPQQAFEAFKVLWPETTVIRKSDRDWIVWSRGYASLGLPSPDIDWGDLTQYPPPTPKWRAPVIDDAIRAIKGEKVRCRVSDYHEGLWLTGTLLGFNPGTEFPWGCNTGEHGNSIYKYCEVEE